MGFGSWLLPFFYFGSWLMALGSWVWLKKPTLVKSHDLARSEIKVSVGSLKASQPRSWSGLGRLSA
jgi:hypothetical protein